jgi:hypothetical protein
MVSVFKCDSHGKRISGSLESAYVNVVRGSSRYSRRLRLCPDCLDLLLQTYAANGTHMESDDDDLDESLCATCGKNGSDHDLADIMRITYYRRGQDQSVIIGLVDPLCAQNAIARLGLELG